MENGASEDRGLSGGERSGGKAVSSWARMQRNCGRTLKTRGYVRCQGGKRSSEKIGDQGTTWKTAHKPLVLRVWGCPRGSWTEAGRMRLSCRVEDDVTHVSMGV